MAINYTYPVKTAPTSSDDILIIDNADDSKATKRVKISTLPISGVTSIVAGTNVTISPVGGTGDVTINSSGGGGITLTTVGTSGVSTLTGTTLNIPDYGSGAVTNITAQSPLASTGGTTPIISLGGLSSIGSRGQFIAVASGGTALNYIDPAIVEIVRASETILQGDPLYITGEVGGITTVGRAQSGDANKMPCVGIARTEITINTDGDMYVIGVLDGLPMNTLLPGASENDVVYVAPTGGLTLIKPTGTNLIQNIGIVTKPTGTGSIQVTAIGRSNGLPNVPQGNIWLGDSNSAPVALPIGGAGTVLTSNGTTASWSTTGVTNYLPLAGGTMTGSINNVSLVQLLEQALPNATVSNTPTFDAASGAYANIFADGPITTFTITVMPNGTTSKLFITTSASASVGTWVDSNSANVIWAGGSAPTLNTNGAVDVITFEFSQGLVYASIIQGYA